MNEDCKTERSAPERIAHTLSLMQRDRICRSMVSPSTVGEYASQIDDAFKEMQFEAYRMTNTINALVFTLKRIIGLENQMQDSIQRTGYVTGGEAGHYFPKAIALAREALKKTFTECCLASNYRCMDCKNQPTEKPEMVEVKR